MVRREGLQGRPATTAARGRTYPRKTAASPQWDSQRSCCHPENPGVRRSTARTTSIGTSRPSTSVNCASYRSAALPSAMHHGHRGSERSAALKTGPV
ncbi:hypothetical protein GCM10022232_07480 [Streptomyces plumbiresistens]|uniref:Uncharacterized protein n=1 Tax=Streptomyces plumbiresistens TaxID=511811 RepID=A0ABP7Q8C8_9ACTN